MRVSGLFTDSQLCKETILARQGIAQITVRAVLTFFFSSATSRGETHRLLPVTSVSTAHPVVEFPFGINSILFV